MRIASLSVFCSPGKCEEEVRDQNNTGRELVEERILLACARQGTARQGKARQGKAIGCSVHV